MILASKSPRRQELLKYITEDFSVKGADVDETLPENITPADAVCYLSRVKAQPFENENDVVIGADTVVAIDGKILGKPRDSADAKAMLTLLSGKTHSVYTGVTVIKNKKYSTFFCETRVTFFKLTEKEIDAYIKTGEPLDKAGAYGIQGYGSLLVEKIDGDYYNVVGLPISKLNRLLSAI